MFPVILWLVSCNTPATTSAHFKKTDGSRTVSLEVEVVATPAKRRKGLMYRREMGRREGMLFVFPEEEKRTFWMKNTYLPLDIIYLDRERRVVSISKGAKPLSTSRYPSEGPAMYVLEVLAGVAGELGVQKGQQLEVEGQLPSAQ